MKLSIWLSTAALLLSTSLSAAHYSCDSCSYGYNYGGSQSGYDNRGYYHQGNRDGSYRQDGRRFSDGRGYYDGRYQDGRGYSDGRYQDGRGYSDDRYQDGQGNWDDRSDDGKNLSQADRDLLDRIHDALEQDSSRQDLRDVNVEVVDGAVILSGWVYSEQDHKIVKSKVEKVDGVKKVDDRLEVKNKGAALRSSYNSRGDLSDMSPEEYNRSSTYQKDATRPEVISDVQLKQKIQDALAGGFFGKEYKSVSFDVHNGDVILRGTVDSDSDKKEVVKRVHDVKGVKRVDDQIRILPVK